MKKNVSNGIFYDGKYYKRLFAVFMAAAVLFSVLLMSFLFNAVLQIRESEKSASEALAQNRYNLINTAFAVIIGGMDSFVKNPYLAEWADAEEARLYYKKAISLYDYIKSVSSQLGSLAYEVAVIGERYNAMTLSGLGSGPFKWYAENETSLTDEQISALCLPLQDPDATAVFPVYGTNGFLQELYFMRKQQWKSQVTFVVFKVLADPIFIPAENENFYISGPNNVYICAYSGRENKGGGKEYIKRQRYVYRFFTVLWTLTVESHKSTGIHLLLFGISFVFSVFIFIVCASAAKRIAGRLYYPLGEIVYKLLPQRSVYNPNENFAFSRLKNHTTVDEFEILRDNSRKIDLLSQELQKTLAENEMLALQKYNRGLLEGIVPEEDRENEDIFFVAVVLLTDESDGQERDRRPYIQLFADVCAIADTQLQYVQYGIKEFVLILSCKTPEQAKEKLKVFLAKLQNSSDSASVKIQAALSDCVSGKSQLQRAFVQARSISEFRHTQPHVSILTSAAVTFFPSGMYDYPLETEKKLLDLLIGGNKQTVFYFDEVVQKNIHSASFSARQNLLYALCGTLIRALQELKSTPEELCGKTVDWTALYTGNPDEKTFNELRNIAVCISDAVRKNTSDTDTKILHLMHSYICANFHRDISLQDLSDEFNITPKYCSKLFARLSNNTFKNYLNAFRVERAQKMLSENPLIKIVELAGKVGFNSATSFIRVFNKYTGISPKVYAAQILKKEASE